MAHTFTRRHLLAATAAGTLLMTRAARAAKPPRKLGVALLGLGHYSETRLAPGLELTEYCELRGIVTGSPDKIPVWQKRYKIKDTNVYTYDNFAKIKDNPDIDVVYVVTPTFLHAKFAIMAAEAGKHVWVEKPMAMTAAECQSIITACERAGVKLSVGYRMQHEPNTRQVIDWALTRPYGPQQGVVAKAGYAGDGAPEGDWRMDRSKGGGALYDMGVYPINAARYATGREPISISARDLTKRKDLFNKADETVVFTLEFAGGLKAECATSVGEEYNVLRVNCAKGWYELSPMQAYSGVRGVTSDGKKLEATIPHAQAEQMDNDAAAILFDTPVLVPGSEGLADIRIVEAALASIADGGKPKAI